MTRDAGGLSARRAAGPPLRLRSATHPKVDRPSKMGQPSAAVVVDLLSNVGDDLAQGDRGRFVGELVEQFLGGLV